MSRTYYSSDTLDISPSLLLNNAWCETRTERIPHGIEGCHAPRNDDDDDKEVIIGGGQLHINGSGAPVIIMKVKMMVNQKLMMTSMIRYLDTNQMDHIDSRDPVVMNDMWNPKGPMGPVVSVFVNLYVKCPIFSAKDNQDAHSHLLHSNDWMNSKGIT